MKIVAIPVYIIALFISCSAQKSNRTPQPTTSNKQPITSNQQPATSIIPGAERVNVYVPLIKGKRIGIFANQTSMVGNTHLVDTLLKLGVNIKVIFGPEHGFRGTASAGEELGNYIDKKTGIPVISLYGAKRKPSPDDLKDIDVLIFDIQDVGVRFYTYISSLQDYMEAAFENSKPLLILDRPNPNGFYVDGPVMENKFKSFLGMQPIPIVYGMTIGEYAQMEISEGWLSNDSIITGIDIYIDRKINLGFSKDNFKKPYNGKGIRQVDIITCINYTHKSKYVLPIKPSPNLPEIQSIYLYPSTCLFEGTALSEGRGTDKPFQKFGHPLLPKNLYSFTPKPNEGAKSSKHYFEKCYGWNLHDTPEKVLQQIDNRIQLKWLMKAYKIFPGKDSFFLKTNGFNRLAGNDVLMQQIKDGKSEDEIRKSWEPALSDFKKIRKKYLLYDDFE